MTTVRPISRFGVLELESSGTVAGFIEKPQLDGWINAGFFVFDRKVFEYLEEDHACVLEQEPLEKLAADGQLIAFKHPGFFYAMDTYRELKVLNDLWDSGRAPWKVWR
jgi:glucose-1-phosphate cytidylyltransferase